MDHLHSRPLGATAAVLARVPAILGGSGAPDLDHLSRLGEVHPVRSLDRFDGVPHSPPMRDVTPGGGRDVLVRAAF